MSQLFHPRANTIARVVLVCILASPFFALAVHAALMNTPHFTNQGATPQQPVPFSHKHHVGELGLDCRYCHTAVETSSRAGVPATHICMSCHAHLYTHARMLAPVRASFRTGKPLHWQQVNRLPDYVYFNHAVHVRDGIGCTTCHGDVAQMPLVRQARRMTMGFCLNCHRNPGKFIRRPGRIFMTGWTQTNSPAEIRKLISRYMIKTAHLTDCSTCHR